MVIIRVLVAKLDGVPGRDGLAMASGSVEGGRVVPITRNFDPRLPPIGQATLVLAGDDLYADLELFSRDHGVSGLFPALGFRADVQAPSAITTIQKANVLCVSLCDAANTDERIPAINR